MKAKEFHLKTYMIAAAGVVVIGAGAWYYFAKHGNGADPAQQTTTAKVQRADIRSIVHSNGRVASNLDVDIKCKASGEIVKLPFDISDTVRKGELLAELDPVDEQRTLDQAQVSLKASEARLLMANRNLIVAESTVATEEAKAASDLESAKARADDARSKANRTKTLYDQKLSSEEEYETAKTAATAAQGDLKRAEVRLEELKTQRDALELKRQEVKLAETAVEADQIACSVAERRVRDTRVVAPMDGVVSARTIQKGQIISSGISNVGGGTTILTLSDLSRIFVYASVDESDIGRVRLGQNVDIKADAFAGRTFSGRVSRIATKGANVSNVVTFEVQIEVLADNGSGTQTKRSRTGSATAAADKPGVDASGSDRWQRRRQATTTSAPASDRRGFLLKPEMTTNVDIIIDERTNALSVPTEAVVRKKGQAYVTLSESGRAGKDVPVETGITDGNLIEIVSGLQEGQDVLVRKGVAESRWNGQRGPSNPLVPSMGGPGRGGRGR